MRLLNIVVVTLFYYKSQNKSIKICYLSQFYKKHVEGGIRMVYDNLKEICKEKHITFQEIEISADLGAGCISRWKDGKVSPNIDTLKKVSSVIGVRIADLVREDT